MASPPVPTVLQFADPLPLVDRTCYEILAEHAHGGLGRILRARDRRTGRMVAIKEVIGSHAGVEARFAREARLTAMLQHPAIVPVYEVGCWPSGRPFYAMKLVEGRSLDKVVADAAGVDDRLRLVPHVLAVAEAVAYAHSLGIIHRDLKPENVLVGPFGETVVIDWGLAKQRGAPDLDTPSPDQAASHEGFATELGVALGTPAYMPPEQARGEPAEERSDVYGLGALLYYVLSGRPAYEGASTTEVLAHVRAGPPSPLESRVRDIPPDLAAIVRKAMMPDPGARYPTGKEMAEDLARFTTGQLVSAHVYSTRTLVRRWIARNRVPVSLGAAALVALAAAGAIAFQREVAKHNLAETRRAAAQRAEKIAVDMRNDMIFLQAQNWLTRDPTAALAWLKRYPPTGPRSERLGALVDEAIDLGVAHHVLRGPTWVMGVGFTRDDRSAIGVLRSGEVIGWDVATGAARLLGRTGDIANVGELSPDRSTVAVGGFGGTVELFSVDGSRPPRRLRGHRDQIGLGAFSPDSRLLLTRSIDHAVRVWDVGRGGEPLLAIENEPVFGTALASDGKSIILGLGSGEIVRVSIAGGARHRIARLDKPVLNLAPSPDGRRLAIQSADQAVQLIDLETGRVQDLALTGGFGGWGFGFSPSGRYLAAASLDGAIHLLELASGNQTVLRGHEDGVYQLVFSADEGLLLSASDDATARVWNLRTGGVRVLRGHEDDVFRVALTTDGKMAATGSIDASVRLWRLDGNEEVSRVMGRIGEVADGHLSVLSEDGNLLLSSPRDDEFRSWNLDSGERRSEVFAWPDEPALGYGQTHIPILGRRGRMLAVGEPHGVVAVWDLDTGERRSYSGEQRAEITALTLSRDGNTLVTGDAEGLVLVRDLSDDAGPGRILLRDRRARGIALSYDGKRLALALDSRLELCDVATGQVLASVQVDDGALPSSDRARKLIFSPDGRFLASHSVAGSSMVLWNLISGQASRPDLGGQIVLRLAFSPDSARLALAIDRKVLVVDTATRRTRHLAGHRDGVLAVAWSPDGRTLASASYDQTIRLWDPDTGRVRVLRGHRGSVESVVFSPDGSTLTSASADGTVRRWNLDRLSDDRAQGLARRLAEATTAIIDSGDRPATPVGVAGGGTRHPESPPSPGQEPEAGFAGR